MNSPTRTDRSVRLLGLCSLGLALVVAASAGTAFSWGVLLQHVSAIQAGNLYFDDLEQEAARPPLGSQVPLPRLGPAGDQQHPDRESRISPRRRSIRDALEAEHRLKDQFLMASFAARLKRDPEFAMSAGRAGVITALDPASVAANIMKVRRILQDERRARELRAGGSSMLKNLLLPSMEWVRAANEVDSLTEAVSGNVKVGEIEAQIAELSVRIHYGQATTADVQRVVDLREHLRRLPGTSGFLDGIARTLGQTSRDAASRTALFAGIVAAALAAAVPLVGWWILYRRWRPRSRATYAIKLSLWPVVISGLPFASVLALPLAGHSTPAVPTLLLSLAQGLGLTLVIAILFFWVGNALATKRFKPASPRLGRR
ncbi:MAG: hypothetical protein KDC98_13985 [Planctomycetes bacterium]|nr:hypothetical protein [Planctomycetota bacterium]